MLYLNKFNVKRNSYNSITLNIAGSIDSIPQPFILHLFIERSGGPEGPWRKIAWKPMYNYGDFTFEYIDYDIKKFSLLGDVYYKIIARYERIPNQIDNANMIKCPNSSEFENMHDVYIRLPKSNYDWEFDNNELLDVTSWSKRRFLNETPVKRLEKTSWGETGIKLKRVYRISQKFERYFHVYGVKCWIFKQNITGPPCPACWDPVKKMPRYTNCNLCFGTGQAHPFVTPIEVICNVWHPSIVAQDTPFGKMNIKKHRILLPGYPEVLPDDVIVIIPMHSVFKIDVVNPHRLYGHTTYQFTEATQLPQNDVKYQLIHIAEKLGSENKNLDQYNTNKIKNENKLVYISSGSDINKNLSGIDGNARKEEEELYNMQLFGGGGAAKAGHGGQTAEQSEQEQEESQSGDTGTGGLPPGGEVGGGESQRGATG